MADKSQFKQAMADLREACHGEQEELRLLSQVERYSGELRREKASLTRRIDELERTVASKDRQIESLKPLTRLHDQIAELEKNKAKLERERDDLRVVVKEWHEIDEDQSTFVKVKAKCMRCSLHFIVCTERPETHSARTLTCPECGQHKGSFFVWKETPAEQFICQSVPGTTPLSEFGTTPQCPERMARKERAVKTIVFDTNGRAEVRLMSGLTDYQKTVGGRIERISFRNGQGLGFYVHDSGRIEGLPLNRRASAMVGLHVFGTAELTLTDIDGETQDVPQQVIDRIETLGGLT
jgi:hypothetical protein